MHINEIPIDDERNNSHYSRTTALLRIANVIICIRRCRNSRATLVRTWHSYVAIRCTCGKCDSVYVRMCVPYARIHARYKQVLLLQIDGEYTNGQYRTARRHSCFPRREFHQDVALSKKTRFSISTFSTAHGISGLHTRV